jgi:hypothetical protein
LNQQIGSAQEFGRDAERTNAMKTFAIAFLAGPLLFVSSGTRAEVTFGWATVGNPGNGPDETGFGSVPYVYRISKHEVTNAQYTEFLNAVATTDTFGLYNPSMGIERSGSVDSFAYSVRPMR